MLSPSKTEHEPDNKGGLSLHSTDFLSNQNVSRKKSSINLSLCFLTYHFSISALNTHINDELKILSFLESSYY